MQVEDNAISALTLAIKVQVEATKENTKQLEEIKAILLRNKEIDERQDQKLEKISNHFHNGFKQEIMEQIKESEEKVVGSLSGLISNIKFQWVIMGSGIVPIIYFFIQNLRGV